EVFGLDVVLERLLAVDCDDRDALAIFALERRVAGYVDLLEVERPPRADGAQDFPRLVAEVAAGLSVERDEGHPMRKGFERRTTCGPPAVPRARTTKR